MSFSMHSSAAYGPQSSALARDSTTNSAVFADSAHSGPSQSDVALLADIVASLRAEARRAQINRKQVQVLAKRMLAVADTLGKLPDNRPTPQLLSVFRSADFLVKCMSRSPVWQHELREHFLCQDRFTALRERLRAVWHLHSTEHWERQDKRAAAEDERPNAALLLAGGIDSSASPWHRPTLGDLLLPAPPAAPGDPPMHHEDKRAPPATSTAPTGLVNSSLLGEEMEMRSGGNGQNRNSNVEGNATQAGTRRTDDDDDDLLPQPSDIVIPEAALAAESLAKSSPSLPERRSGKAGSGTAAAAAAREEDLIAFYRRRHLGSWKLRYEDLDYLTKAVVANTGGAAAVPSSPDTHPPYGGTAEDEDNTHAEPQSPCPSSTTAAAQKLTRAPVAPRFVVQKGFLFNGHPVVVKELAEDESASLGQSSSLLTPYTITSFVQDAVARTRWCHPSLPRYHGAYTERFLTSREEAELQRAALAAGCTVFPLFPSSQKRRDGAGRHHHGATGEGSIAAGNLSRVFHDATDLEASLDDFHRRNSQASFATAAQDLRPVMALGFVMEDVTFCADGMRVVDGNDAAAREEGGEGKADAKDRAESEGCSPLVNERMSREEREGSAGEESARGHAAQTTVPALSAFPRPVASAEPIPPGPITPVEFVCLKDLLFDGNGDRQGGDTRLSLLDSVDVVLQVGEVLQYMLLDQVNVPPEVCTAWLSVAPSNLYLASAPPAPMLRSRQTSESCGQPAYVNPFVGVSPRSPPDFGAAAHPLREQQQQQQQQPVWHSRDDSLGGVGGGKASKGSSIVFTPYGDAGHHSTFGGSEFPSLNATATRKRKGEPPSFTFGQFPLPYTVVSDAGTTQMGQGERPPSPLPRLTATTSHVYVPLRESTAIKYAPPTFVEGGPCSRWRPHPRAASPACYTLAQLYLALTTAQPPYRHIRSQQALRTMVLCPDGQGGNDGQLQGYTMPRALPLPLCVLLRMAMSFAPLTAEDYRVEKYRALLSNDAVAHNSSEGSQTPAPGGSAGELRHGASCGDYAGSMKAAEEDCAYLLSRLHGSSCNVATNSSASFADSGVGSTGTAVPRVLSVQMFLEGLAIVAELLEARGLDRRVRLDLSCDRVYGQHVGVTGGTHPPQQQQRQPRYVDPHVTEVVVADSVATSAVLASRHAPSPTPTTAYDDYGEV